MNGARVDDELGVDVEVEPGCVVGDVVEGVPGFVVVVEPGLVVVVVVEPEVDVVVVEPDVVVVVVDGGTGPGIVKVSVNPTIFPGFCGPPKPCADT